MQRKSIFDILVKDLMYNNNLENYIEMTYYIRYYNRQEIDNRCYNVFDIEYYMKDWYDKWHSDLHSNICADGFAYFLRDRFADKTFNIEEFVNNASEIENVRELLYNGFGIDNSPKKLEDAEEFHYHTFRMILEEKLNTFAKKYDLVVVKD